MRVLFSSVFAVTLAASNPASVAAKEKSAPSITVEPSMPWNVDFGDQKCRLTRVFGEEDNRHLLFFEQFEPSSFAAVTVSGPGFRKFRFGSKTKVHSFDEQEPIKTEPYDGKTEQFGNALIYRALNLQLGDEVPKKKDGEAAQTESSRPFLDTDFADKVQYLNFQQGKRSIRLNTGPLGDAFKVLNRCTGGLITEWGLDLEQHKGMTRRPEWTNQAAIARRIKATYPSTALRKGESGIFRMRVIVDEAGKVTECVMNKTTVAESLDSPACREMEAAKFMPALDANGEPMRSYYVTSITYALG